MANNCKGCRFSTPTREAARLDEYQAQLVELRQKYIETREKTSRSRRGIFGTFNMEDDYSLDYMAARIGTLNQNISKGKDFLTCARFPKAEEVRPSYVCGEFVAIPNRSYTGEYKK